MKEIFDKVSYQCSEKVTKTYSTSFSMATKLLSKSIRKDIYNIYGFVRFADEIVDSFHSYNKTELLVSFAEDLDNMLKHKLPLLCANPDYLVHNNDNLSMCGGTIANLYSDLGGKVFRYGKPYKPIDFPIKSMLLIGNS